MNLRLFVVSSSWGPTRFAEQRRRWWVRWGGSCYLTWALLDAPNNFNSVTGVSPVFHHVSPCFTRPDLNRPHTNGMSQLTLNVEACDVVVLQQQIANLAPGHTVVPKLLGHTVSICVLPSLAICFRFSDLPRILMWTTNPIWQTNSDLDPDMGTSQNLWFSKKMEGWTSISRGYQGFDGTILWLRVFFGVGNTMAAVVEKKHIQESSWLNYSTKVWFHFSNKPSMKLIYHSSSTVGAAPACVPQWVISPSQSWLSVSWRWRRIESSAPNRW